MEQNNILKPATLDEAFEMDLQPAHSKTENVVVETEQIESDVELHQIVDLSEEPQSESLPFIVANTEETTLRELKQDCIIPVFSKDNEKTLAHTEFIEITQNSIAKTFPHHSFNAPEVRVSHSIKGRIPEAIHKNAKDLLEFEKTMYWERMAFIIKIPAISDVINGNRLSLTIGGVRSYNLENLYSKKSMERFKFFIGFQNQICMNLCVWSDGFVEDMRVSSYQELESKVIEVLQSYQAENHLKLMKEFPEYSLTETQFAQLIGKSKLYHYLSKEEKSKLPELLLNDGHMNAIAKDYYQDKSFCRNEEGNINLWNVFNLFTSANKSSYIDTFLDRNANVFDFTKGLQNALNGDSNHSWFLS